MRKFLIPILLLIAVCSWAGPKISSQPEYGYGNNQIVHLGSVGREGVRYSNDVSLATMVDMSGGSETGIDGTIVAAYPSIIEIRNFDRDNDRYSTHDEGAASLTDFTQQVDVNVTELTNTSQSAFVAWAISNADDDLVDIIGASGDSIYLLAAHFDATHYKFSLNSCDGGVVTETDASSAISVDTPSYLKIIRSDTGATLTVEIYSTLALKQAGGAGDVDTITGTVVNTAFQYVYGIGSVNIAGTAKDISGWIANLTLEDGNTQLVLDPGFDVTEEGSTLHAGDFVNTGYDTFDGVSSTGFHAITDGTGSDFGSTPDTISIVDGNCYKASWDITLSGGTAPRFLVRASAGAGTAYVVVNDANAVTEVYFNASATDTVVGYFDSIIVASEYTISNFKIVPVTFKYWTAGTGWAPGASAGSLTGKANKTAGTASDLEQDINVTSGNVVQINHTITRTAGTDTPQLGGVNGTARNSADTYLEYITTTGAGNLKFQADAAFAGAVDNVGAIHFK